MLNYYSYYSTLFYFKNYLAQDNKIENRINLKLSYVSDQSMRSTFIV